MWVKICGVTRPEDAAACVAAGADAIGVNLYTGPRRIGLERAAQVAAAVSAPAECVALVDGAAIPSSDVLTFLREQLVRCVQVYRAGPDTAKAWAGESFRLILPCRVSAPEFAAGLAEAVRASWGPWAVLLDSPGGSREGGTGQVFRWDWVREARERGDLAGWPRLVLAGGLTPDNVAEGIRQTRPFGVDVSSGVESEPGIKDRDRVRRFVEAARAADG